MAHFQIENLSFAYHTQQPVTQVRPALQEVSLNIEKGEYLVLCGKSGSGKSTLLRHLKTVLTPNGKRSGSILFDGCPLEEVSRLEQSRRIGFVMQNPDDQIVTDKVWHELAFGLESLGVPQSIMRLRVAEMASYFGIQSWFHREVAELSGGQKQLLNLASIMAVQPEVLILDEPTSQLDPVAATDFLNTVRKINIELGTTIIITEHRLEDIYHAADRVVVMDRGRVIADDDPRKVGELLWQQKNEMFAALPTPTRVYYQSGEESGSAPLTVREGRSWLSRSLEGCVLTVTEPEEGARAVTESVERSGDAGNRKRMLLHTKTRKEEPVLRVRDAWFRYEREAPDILKGFQFSVAPGSLTAIVGGNGAGKSTALKVICGICTPYRGQVEVFGKAIKKYKAGELYRNCLSMLPQDPRSLFVKRTVREDLEEMCGDGQRVEEVAERCEIRELLDAHPYDLSGGELQRAALAKVLLNEPRLLLLDEPTKGLDSFFKQKLAGILRELTGEGITIILVSHDIEFCAEYADQVSMFFDGQIVTTETPHRFFGQNSFYTTAANRMSRCVFQNAVTVEDVVTLYQRNRRKEQEGEI